MGKVYDRIDDRLAGFIGRQKVFFVASAPLSGEGLVNLSPKGLDTFAILDDTTVAYLDLTGSGIETVAHLKENGRIVVMFCSFDGPPLIVRVHGRGEVVEPDDPDFADLVKRFPEHPGVRSVIRVRATRISDSCGFGVPLYRFEGERDQLGRWAEKKGPEGIREYQAKNNRRSLDALPGLEG